MKKRCSTDSWVEDTDDSYRKEIEKKDDFDSYKLRKYTKQAVFMLCVCVGVLLIATGIRYVYLIKNDAEKISNIFFNIFGIISSALFGMFLENKKKLLGL